MPEEAKGLTEAELRKLWTVYAVGILHRRYIGDDPLRQQDIEIERLRAEVAKLREALEKIAGYPKWIPDSNARPSVIEYARAALRETR